MNATSEKTHAKSVISDLKIPLENFFSPMRFFSLYQLRDASSAETHAESVIGDLSNPSMNFLRSMWLFREMHFLPLPNGGCVECKNTCWIRNRWPLKHFNEFSSINATFFRKCRIDDDDALNFTKNLPAGLRGCFSRMRRLIFQRPLFWRCNLGNG